MSVAKSEGELLLPRLEELVPPSPPTPWGAASSACVVEGGFGAAAMRGDAGNGAGWGGRRRCPGNGRADLGGVAALVRKNVVGGDAEEVGLSRGQTRY